MMRGIGLPLRRRGVIPLLTNAPRRCTSITPAYSSPYPKHPDAAMIGFRSLSSLAFRRKIDREIDRRIQIHPAHQCGRAGAFDSPDHLVEVENRSLYARGGVTLRCFDDATQTGAKSAGHVSFD